MAIRAFGKTRRVGARQQILYLEWRHAARAANSLAAGDRIGRRPRKELAIFVDRLLRWTDFPYRCRLAANRVSRVSRPVRNIRPGGDSVGMPVVTAVACGVTLFDAVELAPVPMALLAVTVKV